MANEAPIISLFNHKGGVSKTTTTFNLGWALAERGKKVLIVDGDPQCNLTQTILVNDDNHANFWKRNPWGNLGDCLASIFQGKSAPIPPGNPVPTLNPNLYLFGGNPDLADYDGQLAFALRAAAGVPMVANLPGAISEVIRRTIRNGRFDVAFVDMSPSVGALNECFLMGSDFFIVPTSPDYYSERAIGLLSKIIPDWNKSIQAFRNVDLEYSIPSKPPEFLGTISQRYRPRNDQPAKAFQKWIDTIKEAVNKTLVPNLEKLNMCISESAFRQGAPNEEPYNLANVRDFNSLIAKAQHLGVPAFALSDEQIDAQGHVLKTMKKSRDDFKQTFDSLAQVIIDLCKI